MNRSDYATIVIVVALLVAGLVLVSIRLSSGFLAFFFAFLIALRRISWKTRWWKKDESARVLEERIRKRYTAIGLTMGLFAILIGFVVMWVLGFGFPSLPHANIHGVLGVICLIVSVLLFWRSQEWSLAFFWFSITNLSVVSAAILVNLLGGDIGVLWIFLTYAGMLIIFVPAYFLAKKVWTTPHKREIEKASPP